MTNFSACNFSCRYELGDRCLEKSQETLSANVMSAFIVFKDQLIKVVKEALTEKPLMEEATDCKEFEYFKCFVTKRLPRLPFLTIKNLQDAN